MLILLLLSYTPRSETEYFTSYTANYFLENMKECYPNTRASPLRIIDLCTGTGCILLFLHALFAPCFPRISLIGVDSNSEAVDLARKNIKYNIRLGLLPERSISEIRFQQGDVLSQHSMEEVISGYLSELNQDLQEEIGCDILISNPPYISSTAFRNGTTARSVRIFEPKNALVPPEGLHNNSSTGGLFDEDLFYHYIVPLSLKLPARLTVLECCDHSQACRVAMLCRSMVDQRQTSQALIQVWSSQGLESYIPGSNGADSPHAVVMQLM